MHCKYRTILLLCQDDSVCGSRKDLAVSFLFQNHFFRQFINQQVKFFAQNRNVSKGAGFLGHEDLVDYKNRFHTDFLQSYFLLR